MVIIPGQVLLFSFPFSQGNLLPLLACKNMFSIYHLTDADVSYFDKSFLIHFLQTKKFPKGNENLIVGLWWLHLCGYFFVVCTVIIASLAESFAAIGKVKFSGFQTLCCKPRQHWRTKVFYVNFVFDWPNLNIKLKII